MTGISHKKARRFLHSAADGLIREDQQILLDIHLLECNSCRAEAENFGIFEARLKKGFQAKWNELGGPSENVIKNIYSRSWRIMISKRINTGLRAVASIAALILLGVSLNFLFLSLKKQSYEPANSYNTGSPNGDLIAFVSDQDGNKEIYVMRSDGIGKTNLTQNPATDEYLTWSPDGSHIAFVSNRDGNDNIYIMNPDGSNLTRLTNDQASDNMPVWSPDGTQIAYSSGSSSEPQNKNIYIVDIKNKNINQVTSYKPNTMVWPYLWSPDATFIFFGIDWQLVKVGINGGDITSLTAQTDMEAPLVGVLPKDGSTFHYLTLCGEDSMSNRNFCYQLRSMNADGTNQKRLATLQTPDLCEAGIGAWAKWSPDQTKILFSFTCEENGWIYMANHDGSNFEPLTNYPLLGKRSEDEIVLIDWSSNSQSIVFVTAYEESKNFYAININDALKNPAIRPTLITNASNFISSLTWQPLP